MLQHSSFGVSGLGWAGLGCEAGLGQAGLGFRALGFRALGFFGANRVGSPFVDAWPVHTLWYTAQDIVEVLEAAGVAFVVSVVRAECHSQTPLRGSEDLRA